MVSPRQARRMGGRTVALDRDTIPATQIRSQGHVIWHDPAMGEAFDPRLFEPDWLARNGLVTGRSTGRNEALFLHVDGLDLVLRHYFRGGLVGRLNRDLFLRQPVARSRAMAEYALLSWMERQGLPVPHPVAARFTPVAGLTYRADIITRTLPGTRTLAAALAQGPLPAQDWAAIGSAIARMHGADVDHADLNCRNILLDDTGRIWLIDFDKSRHRADGPWKRANLERLKRSLLKEARLHPAVTWDAAGWQALLNGYAALA